MLKPKPKAFDRILKRTLIFVSFPYLLYTFYKLYEVYGVRQKDKAAKKLKENGEPEPQVSRTESLRDRVSKLEEGSMYKQQQNSNVFFQTKAEEVMKECKNTMEGLIKEYKSLEKPECENDTENDDADTEPIPEAGS